jgi:hypothetical protein
MKKILLFALALSLLLTGCDLRGKKADFAATALRNDKAVADSALRPNGINPQEALRVISDNSGNAADKIDPEKKNPAVTTADNIIIAEQMKQPGQPNPELKKIYQFVDAGPGTGSFGWGSILGFGVIALGFVGKFMGPPWNIAGTVAQGLASKFLPTYERDRKVAMGTVVAVDTVLSQYGTLLDAAPETKAKLAEKLGMDPVTWMKDKLEKAHQDLGVHEEVDEVISLLKREMTTTNGVLTPATVELDKLISRKI